MAYVRTWFTVAGCGLVCWYSVASAQTFYKWTDDRGVVHFSDSPPANTKDVEERSLPQVHVVAPQDAGDKPVTADGKAAAGGSYEGPARVVLVSRHTPRTGASAVHVSGEVKNVGGEEARSVSVTLTAVDLTAGTPCLRQEVDVSPSTLRPGESGNFDTDIDNPCLSGDTPIDIATSSQ